jgi:hypothetical protein
MKNPLDLIRFNAPIPAEQGPWVPILSPKPGCSVMACLVCPDMCGVETHFIDNRTRPCLGYGNGCPGCLAGCRVSWKGYLGAWLAVRGRYALVELTKLAADQCGILLGSGLDLRGWWVHTSRAGAKVNSAVQARFYAAPPKGVGPTPDPLPGAFDMRLALLRVWGLACPPQSPGPSTADPSGPPVD